MREISPATTHSCEEYLALCPSDKRQTIVAIRAAKATDSRPLPSRLLIDRSRLLTVDARKVLVDRVAALVDENLFGRSDMCQQFAWLVSYALRELGIANYVASGTAMYFASGKEVFRWEHSWVRAANEVIDGNTDILDENPLVPKGIVPAPFWGPIQEIPKDRRLREAQRDVPLGDRDVTHTWWPELKLWIESRHSPNT